MLLPDLYARWEWYLFTLMCLLQGLCEVLNSASSLEESSNLGSSFIKEPLNSF